MTFFKYRLTAVINFCFLF